MSDEPYLCAGPCGRIRGREDFHEFKRDRKKQVTARCKECRSEDYYTARYPDTVCGSCVKHRPLDSDGVCARCHEAMGLRECRGPCQGLLPALMMFYGRSKVCRDCQKVLKAAT